MGQVGSSRKALPSLWRFQPASGKPPPEKAPRGTGDGSDGNPELGKRFRRDGKELGELCTGRDPCHFGAVSASKWDPCGPTFSRYQAELPQTERPKTPRPPLAKRARSGGKNRRRLAKQLVKTMVYGKVYRFKPFSAVWPMRAAAPAGIVSPVERAGRAAQTAQETAT